MGDVPFYGTAAANIASQNIALNSGFRPAWTESEAVKIEEGAIVENSVIMPNAIVEAGAAIKYSIVGQGAVVGKCAKVGEAQDGKDGWKIAVVGPYGKVADKQIVKIGEMVD